MIETHFPHLLAWQNSQGAGGAPSLDAKPTLIKDSTAHSPEGTALTAAPADSAQAPGAGAGGAGNQSWMLLLVLMLGAVMVFTMVSGNRERKKRAQMLSAIKKHDKVMTVGGIVGSVVELKDDTVILKVDETTNTRLTVSKSAISQVLAADKAD